MRMENSLQFAKNRSVLHYVATLLLMSIYGTQVCPFMESLSTSTVATLLTTLMGIQYLLRHMCMPRFVETGPIKGQVSRAFQLEWGLFGLSGLFITGSNMILFDFPIESGFKLILGFMTLGFFAATDLALHRERALAHYIRKQGIAMTPDNRYFPLSGKFALFSGLSSLFLVSILFLVVVKDLEWLTQWTQNHSLKSAQPIILGEFAFIGITLLLYMLLVIYTYSKNLNHFFQTENQVLAEATAGNLNGTVTVSTNDEFGAMAHHTNIMIRTLDQRNQELQKTQDVTIFSLASLAETRDNETGAHLLRTQRYMRLLAQAMKEDPRFSSILDERTIDLLYKSAPLHDIGKVGIPDRILLKPGRLDEAEFKIMKTHAQLGGDALQVAEGELGSTSFLRLAREIATTHHEKWDGSGYPNELKEEETPLSGRLMAVADVYDALISKRVYKPAFSHQKAMEIIRQGSGTHFDPDVVEAFIQREKDVLAIASQYADRHHAV